MAKRNRNSDDRKSVQGAPVSVASGVDLEAVLASVDKTMETRGYKSYHHNMHDLIEAMLADGFGSHAQTLRLILSKSDRINESILIGPGLKEIERMLKDA